MVLGVQNEYLHIDLQLEVLGQWFPVDRYISGIKKRQLVPKPFPIKIEVVIYLANLKWPGFDSSKFLLKVGTGMHRGDDTQETL